MYEPYRIALLQHGAAASPRANLELVEAMARDAASDGASLVVTQELFLGPYFPQVEDAENFDLAEEIPGPTSERLRELACELEVAISASLFEQRARGLYHNTSIMIGPDGSLLDRYRKMHIPDDPRFYEKFYFTPGDLGFRTQTLPGIRTGMLVCWDQWFPEAARATALRGAELLLYPTAIGWYHGETPRDRAAQLEAWRTVQRSHAIANGVFVAACNRIGTEDDLLFWGSSFVVDPSGQLLAEAPPDEDCILVADLDLAQIETARRGWPFLRDRRIEAYEDLRHRFIDEPATEP